MVSLASCLLNVLSLPLGSASVNVAPRYRDFFCDTQNSSSELVISISDSVSLFNLVFLTHFKCPWVRFFLNLEVNELFRISVSILEQFMYRNVAEFPEKMRHL